MPRRSPAVVALLLSLGAAGCVDQALEIDAESAAIVNGALNPGDAAVVALTIGGQQFCTGTLVTPTMVVTAAHCLPPNLDVPMTSIEIFIGANLSLGGEFISVVDGLAHPAWNESVIPNDVGVVELSRPASVAPIPMLDSSMLGLAPVGKTVRMVGYGITAFEGSGNGVKRAGDMEIDFVDDSTIYLVPGPSATCSGDSGGPLLMNVNGTEVLAGIHSRSDCQSSSINERVDIHAAGFIADFIDPAGAGPQCSADGECADDCAQPDPDCPLECGADDGVCDEDCESADPDCGPRGDEVADLEGGCSTAGGSSGGSLALLLLGLLALRRRRR